jgi:hypothetical protein
MRANRVLVAKGWYWVSLDGNNHEGVFRLPRAVQMLREVPGEAREFTSSRFVDCVSRMTGCRFLLMPPTGLRLYSSIWDSSRKKRSNF